jgi:DNA polymerase-3 subunit chi
VPAVAFHFKVEDRVAYTVRLLRKAYRSGARVTVVGAGPLLDRIDQQLWTAVALDFIPHARLRPGAPRTRVADASPILLCDGLDEAAPRPVLVNLTDELPHDPTRFDRIVEVVPTTEPEVQAARDRWRRYRELGFPPEGHDAAAGG